MSAKTAVQRKRVVDDWNKKHQPQYEVRYWTGAKVGPAKVGTVYSYAELLGGHTPVVYISGAGAVALSHVEPL